MQGDIASTLRVLQTVALIIGILSFLGPFIIGALLWKLSKQFASKEDLNGLGSRVTAYESFSIQTRERADQAHELVREHKATLEVELRYIRRDLDQLLKHAEQAGDRANRAEAREIVRGE